jgi:pyrimidine-nucleoside phosphorylase/thymidine phosphorylase
LELKLEKEARLGKFSGLKYFGGDFLQVVDLIAKKRDGKKLTEEEINFLVHNYAQGAIPDYQMAAFLMAVFFQGLDFSETRALTKAFISSGKVLDLSCIPGLKVDKHSTGGVGDKTSLVVVPLVAAAGATVVKLAGRALGHTGGTIDKLESIPGFRVNLHPGEIKEIARRIGAVISEQTSDLVPADKKIYALRDVTATVDCIPLIVSSIVSKKIAGGTDGIVFDVKVGSGGFLSDLKSARQLAQLMVALVEQFGKKAVAVLSNMEQPLGLSVGNALEVREAILTLQGKGPPDLVELCLELGSQMLLLAGVVPSVRAGKEKLRDLLQRKAGLEKLQQMILAQGGNSEVVANLELLPCSAQTLEVKSCSAGYIKEIAARSIGNAALLLGAGRLKKGDQVDPAVGVTLMKKVGDYVTPGETLAVLHFNSSRHLEEAQQLVATAFHFSPEPPEKPALIFEVITP